jgi:hypothetical protein
MAEAGKILTQEEMNERNCRILLQAASLIEECSHRDEWMNNAIFGLRLRAKQLEVAAQYE